MVGNELGTGRDDALDVWHWDAAIFLLILLSVPCFFLGAWMVVRPATAPCPPARAS
jgi:hypothetical protein